MTTPRSAWTRAGWWRFARHHLQMLVAMLLGMAVLGPSSPRCSTRWAGGQSALSLSSTYSSWPPTRPRRWWRGWATAATAGLPPA
jgi:hypothetical protein